MLGGCAQRRPACSLSTNIPANSKKQAGVRVSFHFILQYIHSFTAVYHGCIVEACKKHRCSDITTSLGTLHTEY